MVSLEAYVNGASASMKGNVKFLTLLGLWPNTTPESAQRSLIVTLLFGLGFSIQLLVFIAIVLAVFLEPSNIDEKINMVYLATLSFNGLFKQAYVRYKTKEFQDLVASMETLFIKATHPLKEMKKEIIYSGNHLTFMLLLLITAPCVLAGIAAPFAPLTKNLDHELRSLPYEGWVPCNKTETPCYEVAYFLMSVTAILLPTYTSCTDLLIVSLIIHTFKQFDILKVLFKNIREIAREEIAETSKEEEMYLALLVQGSSFVQNSENEIDHDGEVQAMHRVLLRTIHDHINLLSFAERLKILASYFLIIQMAVDVVILCLLTVQFTLYDSFLSFQFLSAFLVYIAAVSLLGLMCWCGGELADKSEDVGSAAFESEWNVADTKFKRSLKMVMMRSRFPCKITIAKIMDFNLVSFAGVLRASYSFFTVLQETAIAHPHHEID